jgi:hypothetical protein
VEEPIIMPKTAQAESAPQSATPAAPNKTLIEPDSGPESDGQFIDNLVAADRFKTFLVGRGVEVPFGVSQGISELVSAFAHEIARAEELVKEEGVVPRRGRRVGKRRSSPDTEQSNLTPSTRS